MLQVLQEKDPNTLAPCSPLVSPLVRPGPAPPGQPRITNQQLDAGSSSYLDTGESYLDVHRASSMHWQLILPRPRLEIARVR